MSAPESKFFPFPVNTSSLTAFFVRPRTVLLSNALNSYSIYTGRLQTHQSFRVKILEVLLLFSGPYPASLTYRPDAKLKSFSSFRIESSLRLESSRSDVPVLTWRRVNCVALGPLVAFSARGNHLGLFSLKLRFLLHYFQYFLSWKDIPS
jgi:hypothetical protein